MADAQTRKAAIQKATHQVRTGGSFVRRAKAAKVVAKPSAAVKAPKR